MTHFTRGRALAAVTIAGSLVAFGFVAAPGADAVKPVHAQTMAHKSLAHSAVLAPTAGTACTFDSGTNTRTCDLWAHSGTVVWPDVSTSPTFWSYTSGQSDPVGAVGPTIVVNQGENIDLVLHNALGGSNVTSLDIPQQDGMSDDMVGIGDGASKEYKFTANRAGTFLYEAGGTPEGARQVGMGMVGAFVVLPSTTGSAYGDSTSSYNDESVVLLTDVDTQFNANPTGYDLRNYTPQLHLLNGAPYPDTTNVPVTAGGKTLLRIINGGIIQHALGVLGTDQTIVGQSSRELSHPYGVAAEKVTAGDTLDMIVSVPSTGGPLYPIYDSSTRLDNSMAPTNGVTPFGGALTFLNSGTTQVNSNAPVVTGLTLATSGTNGSTPLGFSGMAGSATDPNPVDSAEYVIDNGGAAPGDSSTTPITVNGQGPQPFSTSISVSALGGLSAGTHTLLVRAHSADGWGPFAAVVFSVDNAGPTTALQLDQTAVNNADLTFTGSASDATTGGSGITSASFSVDGGAVTGPLSVSPSGKVNVALDGTITAAQITGLAEGSHTLTAQATDAYGNVGPASAPMTFVVDRTGPTVNVVTITPSPNSGSQGVAYDPTSVEVRATFTDTKGGGANSGVVDGEAFLQTQGADGSGFPLYPYPNRAPSINDGSGGQTLLGTFPVSELNRFADGNIPIYVHARDAAGNWGTATIGTLVLSRDVILKTTFDAPDPVTLIPPFFSKTNGGTLTGALGLANGGHAFTISRSAVTPGNYRVSSADKAYLLDPSPASETRYNAAFTFSAGGVNTGTNGNTYNSFSNPNGARVASIFGTRMAGQPVDVFDVEYRGWSTTGTSRQVRLAVNTATGVLRGSWVTLPAASAGYRMHVQWVSGTSTTAILTVDGVGTSQVNNANTVAYVVDYMTLGISSMSGSATQSQVATGTAPMWLDNIDTRRKTAP